ncbi:glycosyltransferase [Formosa sp. S-31]|uniref:glycosyltransferase n=1 Tax=Formosa sp. S-31 TaxID=2790949 RepID=UPI003EBEA955
MIPKHLHYVWFGTNKFPQVVNQCLDSWKKELIDFQFHFWNIDNIELDCNFAKQAFEQEKWAFLSDYVRLKKLYEYGGVYLDTDMLVVKGFEDLLCYDVFFGKESETLINGAIIGAKKESEFIKMLIDYYRTISIDEVEAIPIIITKLLKQYDGIETIKIYPVDYFYPFPYSDSYKYKVNPISYKTKNTYTIHLWYKSWKNDMFKYTRVKNHIGAFKSLLKHLKKNPFSLNLWSRIPGTTKLSLIQLWNNLVK